ncbi:MAG: hypothetical protein ACREDR_06565, partial [Blastocatellia bacterium]
CNCNVFFEVLSWMHVSKNVSAAAEVAAVAHPFVNTARYLYPDCDGAGENVREVLVAPGMFVKVVPPSVLTCHCNVGVGLPVAAAVKVTLDAATL